MDVGERIRDIRKKRGMTQKQLAEKLGVSVVLVCQYELGKRLPKYETVERIAAALGVGLDAFDIAARGSPYALECNMWEAGEPENAPRLLEVWLDVLAASIALCDEYPDRPEYRERRDQTIREIRIINAGIKAIFGIRDKPPNAAPLEVRPDAEKEK